MPSEGFQGTPGFLKDVFLCSLGAYGGPSAHYGIFSQVLVEEKGYLSAEELTELIALCTVLPGPSSTQTLVAVGMKLGGPKLASLTMLVWALPVIALMSLLAIFHGQLAQLSPKKDLLRFIAPMAVGFILVAAYRIGKNVLLRPRDFLLAGIAVLAILLFPSAWTFPVLLLLGAAVSFFQDRQSIKQPWRLAGPLRPRWQTAASFLALALGGPLALPYLRSPFFQLFERFYRYGYLVFGGGQVVIPLMYTELVEGQALMSGRDFLLGYGLVQGLPGPMFSFSAYAGGMAMQGQGVWAQVLASLLAALGIFLPGLLLIFFLYPLWQSLRHMAGIQLALAGVKAVAGGMILAAAIKLLWLIGAAPSQWLVVAASVLALLSGRVKAPFIVLGSLFLAWLI